MAFEATKNFKKKSSENRFDSTDRFDVDSAYVSGKLSKLQNDYSKLISDYEHTNTEMSKYVMGEKSFFDKLQAPGYKAVEESPYRERALKIKKELDLNKDFMDPESYLAYSRKLNYILDDNTSKDRISGFSEVFRERNESGISREDYRKQFKKSYESQEYLESVKRKYAIDDNTNANKIIGISEGINVPEKQTADKMSVDKEASREYNSEKGRIERTYGISLSYDDYEGNTVKLQKIMESLPAGREKQKILDFSKINPEEYDYAQYVNSPSSVKQKTNLYQTDRTGTVHDEEETDILKRDKAALRQIAAERITMDDWNAINEGNAYENIASDYKVSAIINDAMSKADFEEKSKISDEEKESLRFDSSPLSTSETAKKKFFGGGTLDSAFDLSASYDEITNGMSDEEKNVFNYILNTEGKTAATEYRQLLNRDSEFYEDIGSRKGREFYEKNLKGHPILTALYSVPAGFFGQFGSSIQSAGDFALGTTPDPKEHTELSAIEAAKQNHGALYNVLLDLGVNLGDNAPSWIIGGAAGAAAKGFGAAVKTAQGIANTASAGTMFLSAGSAAYSQAIEEGYSAKQAQNYGVITGLSEAFLEKALGGIAGMGGKITGKSVEAAIKNIEKAGLRMLAEGTIDMAGEFTEEYLQEILDPVFRNITLDENNEFKPFTADALYAGMLGALSAATVNAGPLTVDAVSYASSKAKNAIDTAAAVKKVGNQITGTDAGSAALKLAENMGIDVTKASADVKEGNGLGKLREMAQRSSRNKAMGKTVQKVVQKELAEAKKVAMDVTQDEGLAEFAADIATGTSNNTVFNILNMMDESTAEKVLGAIYKIQERSQNKSVRALLADAEETYRKAYTSRDIAGIKKSGTNIKYMTSDGNEVTADEIGLSSREKVLFKNAVSDMSETDAGEMISEYRRHGEDISPDVFAYTWCYYRNLGKTGATKTSERVTQAIKEMYFSEDTVINDVLVTAALAQGAKLKAAEMTKSDIKARAQRIVAQRKGSAEGKITGIDLVSKNKRGAKTVSKMLAKAGYDIAFVDEDFEVKGQKISESSINGIYDVNTNTIYLRANAVYKATNVKGILGQTLAHEITHSIKAWNRQGYEQLTEYIRGVLGADMEQLVTDTMKQRGMGYTEALDEVIADGCEMLLRDSKTLAKIAMENAPLYVRIREKIAEFVSRLRKAQQEMYEGTDVLHDSALALKQAIGENIEELQQTFDNVLYDSITNMRNALETAKGKYKAELESNLETLENAAESGIKYSYEGEKSRTADLSALEKAKELEKQGKDSEYIRENVGWFRGYDGKWRHEIDDSRMKYYLGGDRFGEDYTKAIREYNHRFAELFAHKVTNEQNERIRRYMLEASKGIFDEDLYDSLIQDFGDTFEEFAAALERKNSSRSYANGKTLKDYLQHDKLFEAYPQLKNIKVIFEKMPNGLNGRFSISEDTIYMNENLRNSPETTLIHEIQHVVQGIEGFTQGTSPEHSASASVNNSLKTKDAIRSKLREEAKNTPGLLNTIGMYDEYIDYLESHNDNVSATQFAKAYDRVASEISGERAQELFWDYAEATEKYYDLRKRANSIGNVLYRKTAGEIEARDVATRKDMTAEQRKNIRPDIDRTDVVFADGGDAYDIGVLDNGNVYVIASRNVIKSSTLSGMRADISDFFNKLLDKNGSVEIPTLQGDILTISKMTEIKARDNYKTENGKRIKLKDNEFALKLRAESHIDELAEVSKGSGSVDDSKNHGFAKDGFSYRTAYFQDFDGQYYKITISVGNSNTVGTVYNVGKIKKDQLPSAKLVAVVGSKPLGNQSSDVRVSYSGENVNSKLQNSEEISERDTEYDAKGFGDTARLKVRDGIHTKNEGDVSVRVQGLKFSEETETSRDTLVSDMEAVAETDEEKSFVEKLKSEVEKANALQKELAEVNRKIKEISFTKGADRSVLPSLNEERERIAKKLNRLDSKFYGYRGYDTFKTLAERKSKEAVIAERLRRKEALRSQEEKYRDAAAKAKAVLAERAENKRRADIARDIARRIDKIDSIAKADSKTKHIPSALRQIVRDFRAAVDTRTQNYDERIAKVNEAVKKLEEKRSRYDVGSAEYEELSAQIEKKLALAETYGMRGEKAEKYLDGILEYYKTYGDGKSGTYLVTDELTSIIEDMKSIVGERPLYMLSADELEIVLNATKAVQKQIATANKLFKSSRSVSDTVNVAASQTKDRRNTKAVKNPAIRKMLSAATGFFYYNNLKPYELFKITGSQEMYNLYRRLQRSEGDSARLITKYADKYRETAKKNGVKEGMFGKDTRITLDSGKTIVITQGEALTLHLTQRREQGRTHLLGEGFKPKDGIVRTVENGKVKSRSSADFITLTETDLSKFGEAAGKNLTAFGEEMQKYMSTEMSKDGNGVSMALYDVELFGEDNYISLDVDQSKRVMAIEKSTKPGRLENRGFTQKTVENATQGLLISSFDDVFASHATDMAAYAAFTLPLNDMMRVINGKTADGVQLKALFGEKLSNGIQDFLNDVNGGIRSDNLAIPALFRSFKVAATGANLRVVIQQPTAIMRSLSKLNPKHYEMFFSSNSRTRRTFTEQQKTKLLAEMEKYTSTWLVKELGGADINAKRSLGKEITYLGFFDTTAQGRLNTITEKQFWLAEKADQLTWMYIWSACKNEAIDKLKNRQKAHGIGYTYEDVLRMAGDRFDEVTNETQVYDSVFARSKIMRSSNNLAKLYTSFFAEQSTTLNMVYEMARKFSTGEVREAVKIGVSLIFNSLFNIAAAAVVDAMRDDDDDQNFKEKYIEALFSNLLDNFEPMGYMPYFRDLINALKGYDVNRSDVELVSRFVTKTNKLRKEIEKEPRNDRELLESAADFSLAVIDMFGIAGTNFKRDFMAIVDTVTKKSNWEKGTKTTLNSSIKDALNGTFRWGKEKSYSDKLYYAVMNEDSSYIKRMKESNDEDEYKSLIKKGLKDHDLRVVSAAACHMDGDFDGYERYVNDIVKDGFDREHVVSAILSAENKLLKDAAEEDEDVELVYQIDGMTATKKDIYAEVEEGEYGLLEEYYRLKVDYYKEKEVEDPEKKAVTAVKNLLTSNYKEIYEDSDKDGKKKLREMLTDIKVDGHRLYTSDSIRRWDDK